MTFSSLKLAAVAALFAVSSAANASLLLVEQYDNFWSTNVNALIDYANNNEADTSAYWSHIDFTDDPNGFAGDIAGSNPWPSAKAAGAAGKNHGLNQTFFARISGNIATDAGDFYFRTFNDDGLFLFVDGELIINDNTLHPEKRFEGFKTLTAGVHNIELFFFENGGEASLEFSIADASRQFVHFDDINSPATLVPEPTTLAVFGLGLFGLAMRRKRNA